MYITIGAVVRNGSEFGGEPYSFPVHGINCEGSESNIAQCLPDHDEEANNTRTVGVECQQKCTITIPV